MRIQSLIFIYNFNTLPSTHEMCNMILKYHPCLYKSPWIYIPICKTAKLNLSNKKKNNKHPFFKLKKVARNFIVCFEEKSQMYGRRNSIRGHDSRQQMGPMAPFTQGQAGFGVLRLSVYSDPEPKSECPCEESVLSFMFMQGGPEGQHRHRTDGQIDRLA